VLEAEVRIPATGILLPFDPRVEVFKLCVENCKVMGSATSPLWLVFKDKVDNDVIIIFKTGDDLRTDVLMLQMIGMMDKMWKEQVK
jgi:phosphatidylinositol-4,5-bisphosphate 3-kinase